MLIGTEGALLIPHGGMPVLLPESKYSTYEQPSLAERNHYHDFVNACLGGEPTASHFAQSGPMTEAILLGTVAIRAPGQLQIGRASCRERVCQYVSISVVA